MRFEAKDSTGRVVSGTLQAASAKELESLLAKQNLSLVSLDGKRLVNNRSDQSRIDPVTPRNSSPQVRSSPTPSASPAPLRNRYSPVLTSQQQQLLYTQWASFLRSGFGMGEMVSHTAVRFKPGIKKCFDEIEAEVSGGRLLSESMADRANTFTPDAVATVRAGELGGQLPEALEVLADATFKSRAFRIPLWYFFFMSACLILCGVGGIAIQKASHSSIIRQIENGEKLPPVGTLLEEISRHQGVVWLGLVLALGFLGTVWLLYRPRFAMMRHSFSYASPFAKQRAHSEAIMRSGWSLNVMLRAGIPPISAIRTGLESIPNLALRERVLRQIGQFNETAPLHQIMARTGLLDYSYVHILQNGELVGDPAGAMESVTRAESANFENATMKTKAYVSGSTVLCMAIFVVVMCFFLYSMYLKNMLELFNRV